MKRKKKRTYQPGRPPGSIDEAADNRGATITVIDYTQATVKRRTNLSTDEIRPPEKGTHRWIQCQGPPTTEILHALSGRFGVHSLVLEDIITTGQRVKLEEHEQWLFTVLRAPEPTVGAVDASDVSLLLFADTLVSIHETTDTTPFLPIERRLENPQSLVRGNSVDFLFQAIVDLVVDSFFVTLEGLEARAGDLEQEILDHPNQEQLRDLHALRQDTREVRRVLWATRDVVSRVQRGGSSFIRQDTLYYVRDIQDHVIHLIDTVTTIRETANGLMELYMTGVSNRMNEVMKVLTIISTVFIPLSFLAGLYGMNFEHMPELQLRWAYPALLGVMGLIVVGMLLFFKRRKWF